MHLHVNQNVRLIPRCSYKPIPTVLIIVSCTYTDGIPYQFIHGWLAILASVVTCMFTSLGIPNAMMWVTLFTLMC